MSTEPAEDDASLNAVLDPIIDAAEHAKRTGDVHGASIMFEASKEPLDRYLRKALAKRREERGIV